MKKIAVILLLVLSLDIDTQAGNTSSNTSGGNIKHPWDGDINKVARRVVAVEANMVAAKTDINNIQKDVNSLKANKPPDLNMPDVNSLEKRIAALEFKLSDTNGIPVLVWYFNRDANQWEPYYATKSNDPNLFLVFGYDPNYLTKDVNFKGAGK